MKRVELDYKVIIYDFNERKPIMFNIFQNIRVYERTIELVNELRCTYSFEDFVKELDSIIMNQEWSRIQYEIGLCDPAEHDKNSYKIDAYSQAHANIEIIADYVLKQFGIINL